MEKKVNLFFTVVVFVVLSVFLAVDGAEAFCIYNYADRQFSVSQTSGHKWGRGFSGTINPGDNQYCNWHNSDCNKEGERDSIVKFNVTWGGWGLPERPIIIDICKDFPIKAGGALAIQIKGDHYECVRYDY